MSAIFVFYGFSGDLLKPPPAFPDGTDRDQSFRLAADTLAVTLRKLFPGDTVTVRQAWTHEKILGAIESSPEPVSQVHIAAHGEGTGVWLAYKYDRLQRLLDRAQRINGSSETETEKAVRSLREDDALMAGLFERGLTAARRNALKAKMAPGASWQIWGCGSGWRMVRHGYTSTHPDVKTYWRRLNFGLPAVHGIAADIAKSLGVKCTAAFGGTGLEFWHGVPKGRKVLINDTKTAARPPFWLWRTPYTSMVTYDPAGVEMPQVHIFGTPYDEDAIAAGKPPKWLTDLYW